MTLLVYVLLGMLALDLFGKLVLLYTRNTYRDLKHTAVDAVIVAGLLIWGAFVLGGQQ